MALPNLGMVFTPFDPLPASDLNDIVENVEALAAGTGLNDAAVTPDKITSGAVTARYDTLTGTASTSYTTIANSPSVTTTVPASGKVLVTVGSHVKNDTTSRTYISFTLSGANTLVSYDGHAYMAQSYPANTEYEGSRSTLLTGLTPGSTTFQTQNRVTGGTGYYTYRNIIVEPK